LQRCGHSRILGHMEPHFGGRGGRRGSARAPLERAPLERAIVVSYRLCIVTIALSVTICYQINGVGHFGPKFGVFPWSRPMMFGSAESEHPRLTNGEVKLFRMYFNLCDHNPPTLQIDRQTDRRTDRRTDRQTDRQTTCNRNAALCT